MATREETETHVNYDHAAKKYLVYTNYPPHLNRFKKDERAKLVREGEDYAEFEIAATDFNVTSGFKRKSNMTEEQRQAAAERLRKTKNVE